MSAPVVIVGAGLAGAACAAELRAAGVGPIVIVERHDRPGSQGSEQNAGLVRSHASNPHTAAMARRGARWWAEQTITPFFHCGSIIVGGDSGELVAGYRRDDHQWLKPAEVTDRLGMAPPPGSRAFFNGLDGIAPAKKAVAAWLKLAEAELRLNTEAELHGETLLLNGVEQPYSALVIAGGAWSRELLELPVQAFARHLFRASNRPKPTSPWLWDLDEEFYLRQEPRGMILSACDERVTPSPDRVNWPGVDPSEEEVLRAKAARRWPELGTIDLLETWVGLRVLTPDDGFILGADRRMKNLYWCTGLGGHGVTCNQPAARIAMAPLTGVSMSDEERMLARAHSPSRFATIAETWS